MEFKGRHGRLPGALFTPSLGAVAGPVIADAAAKAPGHRSHWPLLTFAFALGLVGLMRNPDWFSDDAEQDSPTGVASPADPHSAMHEPVVSSHASIEIGMATDTVRGIEGEPMTTGNSRWEYGPSWIRFENGVVVDWYSSPMHPLKTSTSQPQPLGN